METIRTAEKAAAFCAALADCPNVGKACRAAGIGRSAAYAWRKDSPEFAAAWDEALQIGVSALEDEAHRRAFEGVLKPVYHQGKKVGTVREFSDTLAIFLLKAHAPEKYRERTDVKLGGSVGVHTLTDEDLDAEMAQLEAQLKGAPAAGVGAC